MDIISSLMPRTIQLVFNKKVENVRYNTDEPGNGLMKALFTVGSQIEADTVLGCDGIRSTCRSLVVGENEQGARPKYTGRYAYRAGLYFPGTRQSMPLGP